MTTVHIIQGDFQITDPSWPRYRPWVPGSVFTSDSFFSPGEIVGSETDAVGGGMPSTWVGRTGGWSKDSGTLRWEGTAEALIEVAGDDYEISFDVVSMPTSGRVLVAARRPTSGRIENNHYRVNLNADGSLTLYASWVPEGGGSAGRILDTATVAAGDNIAVRVVGNRISAIKNGVEVASAEDSLHSVGGFAGLIGSSASGAVLDNMKLTAL